MNEQKPIRKYCCSMYWPSDSRVEQDVFVGVFADGSHRLLGCRPKGLDYVLDDERQSKEDCGIVKQLTDLDGNAIKGKFRIRHHGLGIVTEATLLSLEYSF